jgi:tetratricopeptide (TPR) repeat protein
LGDQAEQAYGLHVLGVALESDGRFDEALCAHEPSLDIFEELGRQHYMAAAQSHLASTKMHQGRYEEARDHALACLALARETDLTFKIAQAQRLLGALALTGGGYAECRRWAQANLAVSEQTGHSIEAGLAHALLAHAARGLGDLERAKRHLWAALQLVLKRGASVQFLWTLSAATLVLADQGARERAVEAYTLVLQHGHATHSRWFADIVGSPMTAVVAALPPAIAAKAQARGRRCDLESTAAELLAEL